MGFNSFPKFEKNPSHLSLLLVLKLFNLTNKCEFEVLTKIDHKDLSSVQVLNIEDKVVPEEKVVKAMCVNSGEDWVQLKTCFDRN